MSWLRHLGDLLAWPDGSGLVGGIAVSVPAYVHNHFRGRRRHREHMARLGAAKPDEAKGKI